VVCSVSFKTSFGQFVFSWSSNIPFPLGHNSHLFGTVCFQYFFKIPSTFEILCVRILICNLFQQHDSSDTYIQPYIWKESFSQFPSFYGLWRKRCLPWVIARRKPDISPPPTLDCQEKKREKGNNIKNINNKKYKY
jgi:hypothetical protein